jgi:hypothetical protein
LHGIAGLIGAMSKKRRFISDAWRGGYLGTYIVNSWHQVVDGSYEPYSNLVVLGAADGGRAHPRIGNRYMDQKELDAEKA